VTIANVNIKKVLLRRGNTTQNDNYRGVYGEISVDMEAKTLRIHDGAATGGYTVSSGGGGGDGTDAVLRANVGAYQTYANANAAAQATGINTINANIGAYQIYANANAAAQATSITNNHNTFIANAGAAHSEINGLRANITAANATIVSNYNFLLSNAGVAHSEIDGLRANITAANAAIASLQSNAGTQQTQINLINANVAAANAAIASIQTGSGFATVDQITANILAVTANAGTQATEINSLRANVTAANSAITTLQTQVYSNVNTAAYLTGAITTGNITAANVTVENNAVILGNLRVAGTQTTVNATTLSITDLWVTVADGAVQASDANGAGLRVDGALANIAYSSITDSFDFNKPITANLRNAGNIVFSDGTFMTTSWVANAGSQQTQINSIDANIGAYQIYANANIGTATTNISDLQANLGSYQIWANSAIDSVTVANLDNNGQQLTLNSDGSVTILNAISTQPGQYLFLGSDTSTEMSWANAVQDPNTDVYSGIGSNSDGTAISVASTDSEGSWVFKTWDFDMSGNLTIPGNINYANGQSILSGITGGGGSTGDLIISGNIITSNDGNTFVNFDSDNELVLGTNTSSNVKIFVDDSNDGDLKTWTFGTDGSLTVPKFGTINFVDPVIGGFGTPNTTTRTPGNRIVLYPSFNGSGLVDYAIGIDGDVQWYSIPDSNARFEWYAGNNKVLSLSGGGILQLPAGGDIVDSTGSSVLGNGGNVDLGDLTITNSTITSDPGYVINIQSRDEDDRVRAELNVEGNNGVSILRAWDGQTSQTFTDSDWTTGEYSSSGSGGQIYFTGAATLIAFVQNTNLQNVYYSINGDPQLLDDGTSYGSDDITFYVTVDPGDTFEVTDFTIYYSKRASLTIDWDENEYLIEADDLPISATGGSFSVNTINDIILTSGDDVRIVGNGIFELRNNGNTNPIVIKADYDSYYERAWSFNPDGNLILPRVLIPLSSPAAYLGGNIVFGDGTFQNTAFLGYTTPVTVGNTAQGTEGSLWYNTEDGRTYVYALDTWIDASPAVVPGNMVGYDQDGNITLNEDARINYANGVSIINSVYSDSQVASFLDDYTGNIAKIGATPLSIAAASVRLTSDNETWTFAPDGVIALPNGMTIESYGTLGVNASIDIGGDDTRIRIDNNGAPPGFSITANATGGMASRTWHFGPDGDLSFPDGSTQTTAYTGGAGGAGNALVNGAYTVALQANGVLTIGANATISNDGEFRLWATDTDITVYRNGQDGYGVKAGNIETFTDNALRTVTNSNGFELKTGNIIIPNDKGVVFANGVNILSTVDVYGNTQVASYLLNFDGDIEFTSSTALIANVDVITVLNSVQSPAYQFANGSEITGAGNSITIQVPSGIPVGVANWEGGGGWNQAFYSDIATTGGTGTGLTVDVAAGGGGYINIGTISINNPGTGYTNGDVITIDNENNIPGTFTVVVVPKNWTFDANGATTFPGNLTIQSNPFNPGTVISQANALMTVVTTGTAATYIGWGEFGDGEPGNIALVAFNDDAGAVAIQTGATTGPEAFNEWIFDADGSTTFPDHKPVSITGNLTVGNLTVNGNATIINTQSYTVVDNIIQMATDNPADTLDLGFVAHRTVDSTLQHTGLIRDASTGVWKLFSNVTAQPGSTVDFTGVVYDDLQLDKLYADTVDLTGTANVANLIISGTAPGTLLGSAGDTAGMIRVDSNYIYYCTSTFVPASWTVGWGGATSNTLFLTQGAYPTPQVGWIVDQGGNGPWTIDTISDTGYGSWQITWVGTPYGSPTGGTATLTNPNPSTIWIQTPLTATVYANTNVAAYLTTGPNVTTANLIATGNIVQQSAYYETYANVTNSGGNLTCNFVNGSTFYATLTANVTVNFANVVATSGRATGATLIVDQGATPYGVSNIQINGGAVQSVRWAGGVGINVGTASNTDIMSFSLISLDGTNWRILGQVSNYA
jgi:hypothetical protein